MADHCFTGKEDDVEVGLIYFGKRYLNPLLQRWISPDPLAIHAPGQADLNLYAYVHGKVLVAVDPVGLQEAPNASDGAMGGSGQEAPPDTSGSTKPDAKPAPAPSGDPGGGAQGAGGGDQGPVAKAQQERQAIRDRNAAEAMKSLPESMRSRPDKLSPVFDDDNQVRGWLWRTHSSPNQGDYYFHDTSGKRLGMVGESATMPTANPVELIGGAAAVGARNLFRMSLLRLRMPNLRATASSSADDGLYVALPGESGGLPGFGDLPQDVAVPRWPGQAVQIPRALSDREMAALMNTNGGVEFHQTFAQGKHWLMRAAFGRPDRVALLPRVAGVRSVSHTHPIGYSSKPSKEDLNMLRFLNQGASRIVTPSGRGYRFQLNSF